MNEIVMQTSPIESVGRVPHKRELMLMAGVIARDIDVDRPPINA